VELALLRILDGPGARGAVVYAGTEALDAQLRASLATGCEHGLEVLACLVAALKAGELRVVDARIALGRAGCVEVAAILDRTFLLVVAGADRAVERIPTLQALFPTRFHAGVVLVDAGVLR